MNKELSTQLRTLNITIDVLLEQYNPSIPYLHISLVLIVKFRYKPQPSQQDVSTEVVSQIQRKVEEIKNAEKQLKIAEKECLYLEKKEHWMKDREYIKGLRHQMSEKAKEVEEVKKQIYNLKKEQKKTERLI